MTNLSFKRATVLPPDGEITFLVNITKLSGYFEIFEGGSVVATGTISSPKDISSEFIHPEEPRLPENDFLVMKKEDFYKECLLRRYMHVDYFQGVTETDVYGVYGRVEWKGKFDSFLDTMLHISILSDTNRDIIVSFIQQVTIDPELHLNLVKDETGTHQHFLIGDTGKK